MCVPIEESAAHYLFNLHNASFIEVVLFHVVVKKTKA